MTITLSPSEFATLLDLVVHEHDREETFARRYSMPEDGYLLTRKLPALRQLRAKLEAIAPE